MSISIFGPGFSYSEWGTRVFSQLFQSNAGTVHSKGHYRLLLNPSNSSFISILNIWQYIEVFYYYLTVQFDSQHKQQNFLFPTVSGPNLGTTQPPIQWLQATLSPEVKRPGRKADRPPPSSADNKNKLIHICTTPLAFMASTGTTLPSLFTPYIDRDTNSCNITHTNSRFLFILLK